MSRTVEVTIVARVRVPNNWAPASMSVDKNMPVLLEHFEYDGFSVLTTPFQPRVLTIAHDIKEESR